MTKTPRDSFLRDSIQPGGRILNTNRQIIVVDQEIVILVGHHSASLDHVLEPVICRRHVNSRISPEFLFKQRSQLLITLCDAPLGCSMHRPFRLCLASVKRHLRIAVIVTQHAGRIGRVLPLGSAKMIDKLPVPMFRSRDCSAPEVFIHVQDMILEIFEVVVRSLGSLEVSSVLTENQICPLSRFIALKMP